VTLCISDTCISIVSLCAIRHVSGKGVGRAVSSGVRDWSSPWPGLPSRTSIPEFDGSFNKLELAAKTFLSEAREVGYCRPVEPGRGSHGNQFGIVVETKQQLHSLGVRPKPETYDVTMRITKLVNYLH
jgi:hypothetical protein